MSGEAIEAGGCAPPVIVSNTAAQSGPSVTTKENAMRTDEEILARISAVEKEDWMGTQRNELIIRLPFAAVKPFLKNDAPEVGWEATGRDRETVLAEMLEYMPFAWEKANGERGISAGRSMDHYTSWVWLLGDDLGDLSDYQFYGKDNLVRICEQYGWDHSQWDDGERSNGG